MNDFSQFEENREIPKKKGKSRLKSYIRIVTFIDLLLICCCVFLVFRNTEVEKQYLEEKERADELEEELKEDEEEIREDEAVVRMMEIPPESERVSTARLLAEKGAAAIEILKTLFPQQVVIADEGVFHFFDIDSSLKLNEYDPKSFSVNESGLITYEEDGEEKGYRGIDVSQHNGQIDWEKAAASGIDFAYIRAGIRGYGSGKLVEDERFEENFTGAKNAGLNVGVYFFTQAVTKEEAVEEAEFVLSLLNGRNPDIPIAVDVEKVESDETVPRTGSLSREQYTENVKAFCERIKEAGYDPIIYGNGKTFFMLLNARDLEEYDKWFADYISPKDWTPYFPYHFRIWQYNSTGSCDGITGDCDLNLAFY